MSASKAIRQAIEEQPLGRVFSSADFLSMGGRAAIDQALCRLTREGAIHRVARGMYVVAGQRVEAAAVAAAVAQKTGERVGLAPSAEVSDILVVSTSGVSRTLKVAGQTLQFRRMSQRKLQLAATPKGRVLLGLWARGLKNLTTLEIKRATADWRAGDIDSYAALIPAWLRAAAHEANASRKSVRIGLSGAYDWSNPQMKDELLIAKVLEKHRFEDVVRLCFFYGLPKVKRVFRHHEFGPMTNATVSRMLSNISKGLRMSRDHA